MLPISPGMDALDVPLEVVRRVGAVGLAAAVALALASLARPGGRGGRRPPLPAAGIALAVAALVAVAWAPDGEAVGMRQVAGVAAAGAGAWVGARLHLPLAVQPALVLPGAVLTVDAMRITDRAGAVAPAVVAAAVLAVVVAESDRFHVATAAGPPLLAVSILGMYATIPETGQILPVAVVAVPIALVGGPARLARLGTPGAAASVVLLVAIVAEGGQARPASIVGGLASMGVLALEPVAHRIVPAAGPPPDRWASGPMAVLVGVHVVVVAVASRVAGLRGSGAEALVIVGVAGALALATLSRHMEHRTPQD